MSKNSEKAVRLTKNEISTYLTCMGISPADLQKSYNIPNSALTRLVSPNTKSENRKLDNQEYKQIEEALIASGFNPDFHNEKRLGKVISFSVIKGGVGKSTIGVNVACILAHRGYKVLLVDADPQGNASTFFDLVGIETGTDIALLDPDSAEIQATEYSDNLDLLPATEELDYTYEKLIETGFKKTFNFDKLAAAVKEHYDFIIIDTPPRGGSYPGAMYNSCDHVFLPTTLGQWSMTGAQKALNKLFSINDDRSKLGGILVNQYESTSKQQRLYLRKLTDTFKAFMVKVIISKSREYQNTVETKTDVTMRRGKNNDNNKSANEMVSLVDEVIEIVNS